MPQPPKAFWEEFWEEFGRSSGGVREGFWEEFGERMEFWELMFNRAPLYFLIQRSTVFVYMVILTIWYINSRLW